MNEGTTTLIAGLINCAADLECTLLPIPIVMRLQLPLRQRLGVMVLLCVGIIATAAGTVRTYFVWLSLIGSWDETWYSYQLWISACVEIDLAVVSAMPVHRTDKEDSTDIISSALALLPSNHYFRKQSAV